jgi:hypothetical protein
MPSCESTVQTEIGVQELSGDLLEEAGEIMLHAFLYH